MINSNIDAPAKLLWNYNKLSESENSADYILALGSFDLRVADRASKLYLAGRAGGIIFSGGVGRLTPKDWQMSEAEMFGNVAIKLNVPPEKIIIESLSTNTGQNIEFSMNMLVKKGVSPKSVILVCQPYMERRAYATFKKMYPEMEVMTSSPMITYENYPNELLSKDEMINIIVGETQRIMLYPAQGYILKQEIPESVKQAYAELVKLGYVTHLVQK